MTIDGKRKKYSRNAWNSLSYPVCEDIWHAEGPIGTHVSDIVPSRDGTSVAFCSTGKVMTLTLDGVEQR